MNLRADVAGRAGGYADVAGRAGGYEAVPLLLDAAPGSGDLAGTVLRRRSARPTRRAVIYLHCMADPFVPPGLATWYTDRGFHFYAADLRQLADPGRPGPSSVAGALDEYLSCLDTAAAHVRDTDGIESLVICAHATGAAFAALWCHARRGSQPVDALILASPSFGPGPWLPRALTAHGLARPPRQSPLLSTAQRRIRRGLDISCPVLVLCPLAGEPAADRPDGLSAGRGATIRLGPHVTWLSMDTGQPGTAGPQSAPGRRFLDEVGRWLSAYLSIQVRDQLL